MNLLAVEVEPRRAAVLGGGQVMPGAVAHVLDRHCRVEAGASHPIAERAAVVESEQPPSTWPCVVTHHGRARPPAEPALHGAVRAERRAGPDALAAHAVEARRRVAQLPEHSHLPEHETPREGAPVAAAFLPRGVAGQLAEAPVRGEAGR